MSYIIVLTYFHGMEIVSHAFSYMSLPQSLRFNTQIPRMSKYHNLFMSQQSIDNDSTTTTPNNTVKNPAATPTTSTNEYSFFDEATIYIRAGSGGQGSSTYKKGVNSQNGPPDGGNGGKGGNVILQVDESLNTLAGLARYAWRPNSFGGGGGAKRRGDSGGENASTRVLSFRAENGIDGARQNKQGRNGKDVVVRVPPGTVVQEEIQGEEEEEEPIFLDVGTVTLTSPTLIVAYGGTGGEGSAVEKLQRGVRMKRNPPQGGQRKRLKLTLKVVADVSYVINLFSDIYTRLFD